MDPIAELSSLLRHTPPPGQTLLLGAGVSAGAGIPTGRQIAKQLLARLACRHHQDPASAAEWYRAEYGEEPTYSAVLHRLGCTPEQRLELVRPFFEGRAPCLSYLKIAELAGRGIWLHFVTTNFDRLLEDALVKQGLAPVVIARPEDTRPECAGGHLVIKVNGDYHDQEMKNTPAELSEYDLRVERLLEDCLTEKGLLICGWSAENDHALRRALLRRGRNRHPVYWAVPHPLRGAAEELARVLDARLIMITGADDFFEHLAREVITGIDASPSRP